MGELEAMQRMKEAEMHYRAERYQEALAWCRSHGFEDVNSPKTTKLGIRKYPLHTAVKHEEFDMVKLLLECGADKHLKNSWGKTPKDLADDVSGLGAEREVELLKESLS